MKFNLFKTIATAAPKCGKTLLTVAKSKSPVIFAGTAIVGACVVAYTTYKCTPKYKSVIEDKSTKIMENDDGSTTIEKTELPKKEKAKIFVKTMWPMMVALIVTITSVIASHKISAKRIATLSAAYSIATQKATEAAEKKAEEFIKDKIGDDAAKEYSDKVEKEHADNEKAAQSVISRIERGDIYDTGAGNQLFMDKMTGTLFRSSTGYIQSRLDCINSEALARSSYDGFITYNEIMEFIIPEFDEMAIANLVGYFAEELCCKKALYAHFDDTITMPNGEVAVIMSMNMNPAAQPDC